MGLWWHCSNGTRFTNSVKMNFTAPPPVVALRHATITESCGLLLIAEMWPWTLGGTLTSYLLLWSGYLWIPLKGTVTQQNLCTVQLRLSSGPTCIADMWLSVMFESYSRILIKSGMVGCKSLLTLSSAWKSRFPQGIGIKTGITGNGNSKILQSYLLIHRSFFESVTSVTWFSAACLAFNCSTILFFVSTTFTCI